MEEPAVEPSGLFSQGHQGIRMRVVRKVFSSLHEARQSSPTRPSECVDLGQATSEVKLLSCCFGTAALTQDKLWRVDARMEICYWNLKLDLSPLLQN